MLTRHAFVLLALMRFGTSDSASAFATVCSVNFTPDSGGPGTVVRINLSQCYFDGQFFIQPGLLTPYAGTGVGPPTFSPVGKPLAEVNQGRDGSFSATITIPKRLPDGSRITNRGLALKVTDKHGNDIAEGGPSTFVIISDALPRTGLMVDLAWPLSLMSTVLILAGGLLTGRFAGSLVRRK